MGARKLLAAYQFFAPGVRFSIQRLVLHSQISPLTSKRIPMKPPLSSCLALAVLTLLGDFAFAQSAPTSSVASLQSLYEDKVKLDVLRPHEVAVADLNTKFAAALDRAQETAQKAGNLDEAIAIKKEKEAVLAGGYSPSAAEDPKTPTSIKTLRTTYRSTVAKLELERDKKWQPLKEALSQSLNSVIDMLTKSGKLDEAVAAKKLQAELLASKALPAITGTPKDIYTNSLGMKFVTVPDTNIMICIHETRKQDYAAFASENTEADASWKVPATKEGVQVSDADDHPVVMVNWNDAVAFCAWLSKKENKEYRLPSDREWSLAVGIGHDEKDGETPQTLNAKVRDEYPWGKKWPLPKDSGNYADLATKSRLPDYQTISEYNDGFPTTAPVMKFKPTKIGIYDLGGNVWEWTQDWFNGENRERTLRGASWFYREEGGLLSSYRSRRSPVDRNLYSGFRCALVLDAKASK